MDYPRRSQQIINPDPLDSRVLALQHKHRSQNIWQGQAVTEISIQKGGVGTMLDNIDQRIQEKLVACGFEGVIKVGTMIVDHRLIAALVERWRPETSTFHLPVGEATITLQDVEVLTGLRVVGAAITGSTSNLENIANTCEQLLGDSPTNANNGAKGNLIRLTWFRENFANLPDDANDIIIERYTRAVIMTIIGGLLFSSSSGNSVHVMWFSLLENLTPEGVGSYAWGAAVLAYIYRELSKATDPKKGQMCGYLQRVQVWAYERMKNISPRLKQPYEPSDDEPYAMK